MSDRDNSSLSSTVEPVFSGIISIRLISVHKLTLLLTFIIRQILLPLRLSDSTGSTVYLIACISQFHRDCIDYKLRYFQTTCPTDGRDVYPKRKLEIRIKSHSANLTPKVSAFDKYCLRI